jgi:hypothetical protein
MDENTTADIEHNKAMEFILLIHSGLFDRHLTRILNAVTARMATPAFQHYRPPPAESNSDSDIPNMAMSQDLFAPDPVASYRRYYLPMAHPDATPAELDAMAAQYRVDLDRYLAERAAARRWPTDGTVG